MNQWRYPASSGGEIQAYGWQGQGEPRAVVVLLHYFPVYRIAEVGDPRKSATERYRPALQGKDGKAR